MGSAGVLVRGGIVFALAAFFFGGCAAPPHKATFAGPTATKQSRGVAVNLEVPRKGYQVGQKVPVTVTATNLTKKPLTFAADCKSLVQVQVYQNIGIGWECVKCYPPLTHQCRTSWKLEPQAQRSWTLTLPVEPDWPTSEKIMLKAVINGLPEAQPSVLIRIVPPRRNE